MELMVERRQEHVGRRANGHEDISSPIKLFDRVLLAAACPSLAESNEQGRGDVLVSCMVVVV